MVAPSTLPIPGCGTVHVDCRYDAPVTFGYDAATSEGKRRPATGVLRSEDAELPPLDRRKLVSQTRDVARNFVVAGWMLRQHLNYTTSFTLQVDTANAEFTAAIERLMAEWQQPEHCDITGRMSLGTMIRTAESRATLDGDVGLNLLADGRLQAIEGDRIRTPIGGVPTGVDPASLVHGVQVDDVGRALAYSITKRGRASDFAPNGQDFQFERMVSAQHFRLHGYFDRFDQVRGISPFAAGLNTLVDIYEGFDLALAKLKLAQLFALAFFRGDPSSITAEARESGQDYTKLKLGKNPFVLDMDVGDQVEFLESKTPSSEFQSFTQLLIQVVLKALDLPYSFFNESFTNYSGARQALLQYEQSASIRRGIVRGLLDFLTAWRLRLWMFTGQLPFVPLEQIKWEWVGAGLPWIDPLKEIQGDLAAVGGFMDCRTDLLKARGKDFETVARKLAKERDLLQELGLSNSAKTETLLPVDPTAEDPVAVAVENVAGTALNGAQITSLLEIVNQVNRDEIPAEAAQALIAAAFPSLTADQIAEILSPLANFTPPTAEATGNG